MTTLRRYSYVWVIALCAIVTIAGGTANAGDTLATSDDVLPNVTWSKTSLGSMTLEYLPADQKFLPTLEQYLTTGRASVEAFFGKEFPMPFIVRVFPNRATMTAYWRAEWGIPDLETQCWMVASGTAFTLSLLSPRAWVADACEHDASDTVRTQLLITHELVHTFHGQYNPRPEFDGLDSLGWFLEGLAVFASGQLEASYLASAAEAIDSNATPDRVFDAWSGKYRYGVSGSIAGYVDHLIGREKINALLKATTTDEVLAATGKSEDELLAGWREWAQRGAE